MSRSISPIVTRLSPVAVTMMSASICVLESSWIPVSVKRSMVSVTTSALPALIASNRSASGTRQTRWSHGLYDGVKWASICSCGRCLASSLSSRRRTRSGLVRVWRYTYSLKRRFFWRVSSNARPLGSTFRRAFAIGSCDGADTTQVGVRCTMVTCSARSVMAGTRVIAVAPDPMTATRFPA